MHPQRPVNSAVAPATACATCGSDTSSHIQLQPQLQLPRTFTAAGADLQSRVNQSCLHILFINEARQGLSRHHQHLVCHNASAAKVCPPGQAWEQPRVVGLAHRVQHVTQLHCTLWAARRKHTTPYSATGAVMQHFIGPGWSCSRASASRPCHAVSVALHSCSC